MQAELNQIRVGSHRDPCRGCGEARGYSSRSPEEPHGLVYLVEPDARTRHQRGEALAQANFGVASFASVTEYFDQQREHLRGSECLIVDLPAADRQAPGTSERLAREARPPVIFTCGESDIRLAICALKAGAVDLLIEPLDPHTLMAAVRMAFAQDDRLRKKRAELAKLRRHFATLTPREREVLPLITGGLLNKQAASILGISEVTLQIHRSQVMRKMQASSVADLVRMSLKLGVAYWHASRERNAEPELAGRASLHGGAAPSPAVALR